ncbi:MAG: hypothetical protein HYR49_03540 [Gammaproteobacteria bacterium]|nr:hypothetical protein [Gammaproteobacteria bacterium]
MDFARRIGDLYPGHDCRFVSLPAPWYYDFIDPLLSAFTFQRKKVVLRHNLEFFRSLDALVAPERTCLRLKTIHGLRDLKLIHVRHGAGDREAGFDSRSGEFDFALLPGKKYVDRLTERGYLRPGTFAKVGWPKFEVALGLNPVRMRFFDNDNPVVVYTPHFDQSVSSWSAMGIRVLDHFLENSGLNLIFAPHIVLFRRFLRHRAALPRRFGMAKNIRIDLGSMLSADMTYMRAADIYLGDVSSQVYEFLLEPRPCIFLNAQGVAWQENPFYAHWHLGQVVGDVPRELPRALSEAFSSHDQYRQRQREAFNYTFFQDPGRSAAQVGADAVADFLSTCSKSPS